VEGRRSMTDPVYLDNAATTPVQPEVLEAMLPFLSAETFGNPSSPHRFGRAARAAVEHAKRQVAEGLGADPVDVIFTSGGTEADNLAVLGSALAARNRGEPFHVAVTTAEHKAVLAAAKMVESLGGEAAYLPVDSAGHLDAGTLSDALTNKPAVLSAMWVNNETGIVQDVQTVGTLARDAGVSFHTDAVQAVGKVPCSVDQASCTLLTISGHKIGAPKGIGALIVRDRSAVEPMIHGGGQQFGIRPGTENVAGIVGLGRAVELVTRDLSNNRKSLAALRGDFERRLLEAIPDARVNGVDAERAPHVSSVAIPGTDSESMIMHLDMAGVACSSGSACTTGSIEPSHVLSAMGMPKDLAVATLRFSFFKQNTVEDVDRVMEVLPGVVERVRKLGAALGR
jgi:cysteine desulfurase